MEGSREVIYFYPKDIPGRAFTVASFQTKEEADCAFEAGQHDLTFEWEGQTHQVDEAKGVLRRATSYPARLLP
jgi:hypothetical protein